MKRSVLSLALTFLAATSAFAGTASTVNTNNITASVAAKCTIGAFSIAFGLFMTRSRLPRSTSRVR